VSRPPCRCCFISAGLNQSCAAYWDKLDLEKLLGYIALMCLCVCSLVVALGECKEASKKKGKEEGEVPAGIKAFAVFSGLALWFAVSQLLMHMGLLPLLYWTCKLYGDRWIGSCCMGARDAQVFN